MRGRELVRMSHYAPYDMDRKAMVRSAQLWSFIVLMRVV